MNAPEGCGRKELSRIAVLQTYIKRRCNMELLAAAGTLTVVELSSAVSESMDYVRLCGVNTASGSVGTGSYPADMIIAAYEQIEEITEASLDTLSDMIVNVRSDNQCLIVRMMLKAENFSYEANGTWQDTGFSRKVSITKENQDMIIVLTFSEGGGANMRLFLENPVNEAMPWQAMCLFALLLFLTAVAITALLIRKKRCRLLWLAIPILCLSYFMEQCFGTASRGYTYSQVAADMQMAIIGLPGWLLLIFCLALALAEILLMQSINLLEKKQYHPYVRQGGR